MVSVFDIFKIGIGPSSSHTIAPFKATNMFISMLKEKSIIDKVVRINIDLYGSLGATGKGHKTDNAVILGLFGFDVTTIDTKTVDETIAFVKQENIVKLDNTYEIEFKPDRDIKFLGDTFLKAHPNALTVTAYNDKDEAICEETYYSTGGGFIYSEEEMSKRNEKGKVNLKYEYSNSDELMDICNKNNLKISDVVMANEKSRDNTKDVRKELIHIADVMIGVVTSGLNAPEVIFEGDYKVRKRANNIYKKLKENPTVMGQIDHIGAFALAVSEENASGHRMVTAPTTGSAGVIPAILMYILKFICFDYTEEEKDDVKCKFLLTAGAIGAVYQQNASLAGADVGCQGEIGVASSMAAGGLAEILGANVLKVCNAAESAMEHHLGMTCDPVGGLVLIPCIERNVFGAVKALTAAKLVMMSDDDTFFVSLDVIVKTMYQTGKDMLSTYKETSKAGLASTCRAC